MGKRIPKSRRHKKLKFVDPCYKGPGPRSKKKHLQHNEPPVDDDVQEMPNGMEEIIDFKNKLKQNKVGKAKKKKKPHKDDFIIVKNNIVDTYQPGMDKGVKKLPRTFKQRKTENEGQFINRLQKMADMALAEAKVEEKYGIEVVNVDKDGNALYKSQSKEVGDRKKEKRKRYLEKLAEKKKRLKTDNEEFEFQKDNVCFGDVVSAPPLLTARPRNAPQPNKPGERKLAAKELLLNEDQQNKMEKKISLTKWKDLPLDKRKEIENERSRAVQMYRLLKNKKASQ